MPEKNNCFRTRMWWPIFSTLHQPSSRYTPFLTFLLWTLRAVTENYSVLFVWSVDERQPSITPRSQGPLFNEACHPVCRMTLCGFHVSHHVSHHYSPLLHSAGQPLIRNITTKCSKTTIVHCGISSSVIDDTPQWTLHFECGWIQIDSRWLFSTESSL